MGSYLDTASKKGHNTKSFKYLDKQTPHCARLRVEEYKVFASENPKTEGDEMVAFVFSVISDELGSIETALDGTVTSIYNMSKGGKLALERRFEEVAAQLATISGRSFKDICANPGLVRELAEDTTAFAGVEVQLTSAEPKDGYYNFRWETPAEYEARMAKAASAGSKRSKRGAEAPAEEDAPEEQPAEPVQPPATKRPARKGKAAEADALDD